MLYAEKLDMQAKVPNSQIPLALEKLLIFGGVASSSKDGLNVIDMRFVKSRTTSTD